jgi:hypothetical protein
MPHSREVIRRERRRPTLPIEGSDSSRWTRNAAAINAKRLAEPREHLRGERPQSHRLLPRQRFAPQAKVPASLALVDGVITAAARLGQDVPLLVKVDG